LPSFVAVKLSNWPSPFTVKVKTYSSPAIVKFMSKLPIRLIGKGRTDVNATFFSGLRIPAGVEVFIFDSGFMSFPVLSAST
jgi:hypothetical protein